MESVKSIKNLDEILDQFEDFNENEFFDESKNYQENDDEDIFFYPGDDRHSLKNTNYSIRSNNPAQNSFYKQKNK